MFWGSFRANPILFGCSGPSSVNQELPSRPARHYFLHPFFQMHSLYFPGKPLDSTLYAGNYRPLRTSSPKCLQCRDPRLQNLGVEICLFHLWCTYPMAWSGIRWIKLVTTMQTDMTNIALESRKKIINSNEKVQAKHRYVYEIQMWPRICFFLCCPSMWCSSLYSLMTSSPPISLVVLPKEVKGEERGMVSAIGGLMVTSTLNKH